MMPRPYVQSVVVGLLAFWTFRVPSPWDDLRFPFLLTVTTAVHNGVNHRYYTFGQETLPTPPEMREVFATGQIRPLPPDSTGNRQQVTALAPIRDSLGQVVAVAEFTARVSGEPEAFN